MRLYADVWPVYTFQNAVGALPVQPGDKLFVGTICRLTIDPYSLVQFDSNEGGALVMTAPVVLFHSMP